MAWVKIPKEHHPIFEAALPADKRISTVKMFGGVCAMVNGNMAAGLWADSMMVRLDAANIVKATKAKAVPFDPMERGKPMSDMFVLPASVMKSVPKMTEWLERAVEFTATLPPKKKKATATKKAAAKKKVTGRASPAAATKRR